jgi:adenine-specific DNA-methyltransferase
MAYRYIGNKTRLLPWLLGLIEREVPSGGTVADLMCGTAAVAAALREQNYRVIASDLMTFSVHHARVRLKLSRTPPVGALGLGSYPEVLRYLNAMPPSEGFFYEEYSPAGAPAAGCKPRQYLSPENAGRLDAILDLLDAFEAEERLSENAYSLLRHDAVLAVNRVANIAGTYGHYWSQWTKSALAPLQLRPSEFHATGRTDHVVTQGRAEEVAQSVVADLCYLDPPYTKRQYAANYHLIETVARGDRPTPVGVSGLRPWRDQYSDFCSKVRIRDAFREVIEGVDSPKFLVSYSEDGLLSLEQMLDFLSGFGFVTCERIAFPRFRSNQSDLPQLLTEYAFVLDRTREPGVEIKAETTLGAHGQLDLLTNS